MQTLPAIAFEARHVQEFVKYGFVKKNATVSKKGHITLNNQTYVAVEKEKFSRQTSTEVVVSEYNGKLLIFENQPDGIYLAEALCQGPSEKPQFNPNKDRLKSSEIDRIIFFLQEKNMSVQIKTLIPCYRQGLTFKTATQIYDQNRRKSILVQKKGGLNIIIRGDAAGPTVMPNGHLDIVPAGNIENWEGFDPFGAVIDKDGNIRGRGTADLKGGLSVQLYTMKLLKQLKDDGFMPKGNLIFSAVVHEEAAEMFGMEYLLNETLPKKNLEVDVVFLCEPTGLELVLGQRGKVELVVTTKGRTSHSSNPKAGINALEKMVPILDCIFNKMNGTGTSHELLGDSSATVTNLVCRPGGLSIIPDKCEISIDRRYMPDQKVDDLLAEFESFFIMLKDKLSFKYWSILTKYGLSSRICRAIL